MFHKLRLEQLINNSDSSDDDKGSWKNWEDKLDSIRDKQMYKPQLEKLRQIRTDFWAFVDAIDIFDGVDGFEKEKQLICEYPIEKQLEFIAYFHSLINDLDDRFGDFICEKGLDGLYGISDDGWEYRRGLIVALGEKEYNRIYMDSMGLELEEFFNEYKRDWIGESFSAIFWHCASELDDKDIDVEYDIKTLLNNY